MSNSSTFDDGDIKLKPSISKNLLYRKYFKRIFDIMIVLLSLPTIIPVMAITWLAIRAGGGPAFFVQERVGRGGQTFRCLKFRTMCVDADVELLRICRSDPKRAKEWFEMQKLVDDPRINRFGRLLRATRLDELPQLINVLKGDMSLIGPRPFMKEQEAKYCEAGGLRYFEMRPGITGLWQITGSGVSQTPFIERIRFDEDYFDRMTFRTDIKIFWRTLVIIPIANGS